MRILLLPLYPLLLVLGWIVRRYGFGGADATLPSRHW